MELHDGLRTILSNHFAWGKCRLDCFIGMLLALMRLKQINLSQLAIAFSSPADIKSRYRRLQRFFQEVRFDYDVVARLIMEELFDFNTKPYYLTLDRTNWMWGTKNLNVLALAVVYKGTGIPIYWLILNKKGNSNQRERIALMQRFIRNFGRKNILGVLGDREFIGDQWWQWLTENGVPYLIRVKENQTMKDHHGQFQPVRSRFSDLKIGGARCLKKKRKIGQQWVWLSGTRLDNKELLIVAGNRPFREPLRIYGLRWEIESLFQSLKGRGFHLEEARITHYYRIKKVMALLAIAFCWAHKVGEWKDQAIKPLKSKTHGRPEQSLFRYGLDHLTDNLVHSKGTVQDKFRLLVLFLCPPNMIVINKQNPDSFAFKV